MKKILLGIVGLCLLASIGYCQQNNEDFPFSKIEQQNGIIKLQFPAQGARWLMGLNTNKPSDFKLSDYGTIIKLKVGDRLELVEKHQTIIIEPIYQDKKVFLKKTFTVHTPGRPFSKTTTALTPVPSSGQSKP